MRVSLTFSWLSVWVSGIIIAQEQLKRYIFLMRGQGLSKVIKHSMLLFSTEAFKCLSIAFQIKVKILILAHRTYKIWPV